MSNEIIEIRTVDTFDGDGNQVYPSNDINSVVGLNDKLSNIDTSIALANEDITKIYEIINTPNDDEISLSDFNQVIRSVTELINNDASLNASIEEIKKDVENLQDCCDDLNKINQMNNLNGIIYI